MLFILANFIVKRILEINFQGPGWTELAFNKLINPDQCGFISKRSSANNLCRLFNIINLTKSETDPSEAVALDGEKAFDRLE